MSNVATLSVDRQPNSRSSLRAARDAILLEPASASSASATKRARKETAASSALARFLSPGWLDYLGDHANRPDQAAREAGTAETAAEADFARLYQDLSAAWEARDALRLEAAATRALASAQAGRTVGLDRTTRRISDYLRGSGAGATSDELFSFVSAFPEKSRRDYLLAAPRLVSLLKTQALAAMVNGTLPDQPADPLFAIKAIGAFELIDNAVQKSPRDQMAIPVKLVRELLDVNISFAAWCFEIDPCRWQDSGAAGHRTLSPLKARIDARAMMNQTAAESQTVAAETVPSDPCDCSGDLTPECLPPDPCCAEINYYVTDTLVLRDRTVRYVASDLAYIENIVGSEMRERTHEFIKTIEDYSEEETTTTKSEERDHTVSERFTVQDEVEKNLKMSADTQASYNAGAYSFSGNAEISRETAQTQSREQFREAVDKAVSKLQVTTRQLTSRRITTREQEKNVHTFDNRGNPAHIVAKYFYVSREVEGQVFSHGLHTTVELLIPDPAALYQHLEQVKLERGFKMKKPAYPPLPASWKDVDPAKFEDYMKDYQLDKLDAPPVPLEGRWVGVTYQSGPQTIDIPDGWTLTSIKMDDPDFDFNGNQGGQIDIHVGGGSVWYAHWRAGNDRFDWRKEADVHATGPQTSVTIDTTAGIKNYTVAFYYYLSPPPTDYSEWQKAAFTAMKSKYDAAWAAYDEAWARYVAEMTAKGALRNPFALKEILLAELKRAAIYMMCQDFERAGVMNMKCQPCGYPEINRRAAAEHCWDWYFWERAFDWRLMSFVFFDYFWNRMCDWPDKFDPGHDDFMFNAFLRSGMARVQIPMSPGMEGDVIWYLKTGQKWGPSGKHPIDPSDQRWVDVIEEIKHSHDCYQNDREGRVTAILNSTTMAVTNQVLLSGSDRYWDPVGGVRDQAAIDNDVGREIFIDGLAYRLVGIALSATSPPYNPSSPGPTMQWVLTLERDFEGQGNIGAGGAIYPDYAHAIGAAFIGAPFRWQEPTNLVWLSDAGSVCLPSYPVKC